MARMSVFASLFLTLLLRVHADTSNVKDITQLQDATFEKSNTEKSSDSGYSGAGGYGGYPAPAVQTHQLHQPAAAAQPGAQQAPGAQQIGTQLGAQQVYAAPPSKLPKVVLESTTLVPTTTPVATTLPPETPQDAFNKILRKKKLSQDAQDVVGGLVEAFMHKVQLDPMEKSCLENSISTFASDVIGTSQDAVIAIQDLVESGGNGGKLGSENPLAFAMDGAVKITSMVGLCSTLAKKCVKGEDMKAMLDLAKDHITDIHYLEHRIVVSGVDIAQELAQCILDFEQKRFHDFGWQIGSALRKTILSTSEKGTKLPEGIPPEHIIEQVSEGVMDGFFATGSEVDVTNSANPNINLRLDLHRCIAGNHQFFGTVFHGIWMLFAQISANKDQHGLKKDGTSNGLHGQQVWSQELMMTMMQLPAALNRCGVDPEMEQMFMQAIQSLKTDKVNFVFPPDASLRSGQALPLGQEVEDSMAKAIKYWTQWKFEKFGKKIGLLFRTTLLHVLPEKYTVDEAGHLRRQLEMPADQAPAGPFGASSVRLALGAAGLFSFLVLFTVRFSVASWRRSSSGASEEHAFASMELEMDTEAVE